jgi:hemolysin activation/secretion protein
VWQGVQRRRGRAAIAFACASTALLAAAPTRAATPAPTARAPCDAARETCFVLLGLTVDGVTAYPQRDLAPLYAADLTREVSMADIVRIAQAITDKYRADGYFLSRAVVPPQAEGSGIVRLRVYEGYVSDLQVEGPAAPAVRRLLADLPGRRPLRLRDLDRRLTLAGELPGVRLKSQLEPVIDDPAQHRLVVKTSLARLTGSLYADNRGTETAGPWQAYGRLGLNSAATAGDQLALSLLTVPEDPKEFTQAELSYLLPLAGGGHLRIAASAAKARDASANFGAVVGNQNRAFNLRLSEPLSRGRKHAVWAALGFDASEVEQDWAGGSGATDELRVVRASLYAERQGDGGRSTTGFLQVSGGLDALGATTKASPKRSRTNADGQFVKVNLHGSHYRDLGRLAGIYLAADAQWAPEPLLGAEQFAVGALPYGRAYNYAEIAGESGIAGLAELRLGFSPKKAKPVTFVQTYAFADAAQVWRRQPVPGWSSSSLASAGVGLRLTLGQRATLRFEAARPLTRTPFATGDKDWRGFVSLSAGF